MKQCKANVSLGFAALPKTLIAMQAWQQPVCVCLHAASRCDAIHLCELNITVPSLTPLCQKLCAQLVSSGALCWNKPAKNEHLGSDAVCFPLSLSLPLYPQLLQWQRVASLSDVDRISYIKHHMPIRNWCHATKIRSALGRRRFNILNTLI